MKSPTVLTETRPTAATREPMRPTSPKVSVIVPVSSRQDDLLELYRTYSNSLKQLESDCEFVFVFDGTAEPPTDAFRRFAAEHDFVRAYVLSHSFGETGALRAGFIESEGELILTLPAYFQVVPEAVPRLLQALQDGADVAVAYREPRHDGWVNQSQTRAFRSLVGWLTGAQFRDIACGARAMKRRVTEELPLYGDLHRFIPAFARQQGFEVVEVPAEQHPDDRSRRVYGVGTYVRRLLDIFAVLFLLKFTEKPLRFFGLVSLWFIAAGTLITGALGIQRLGGVGIANRPLLLIGVLLIALGVQIAGLGLVGEIIVHWQAGTRPLYRIKRPVREDGGPEG